MPLTHLGRILRRNLWIILVATLLGAAIALAIGLTQRPEYTATARTLFSVETTTATSSELTAANTFLLGQLENYQALATSPVVLDPVIQELGLGATPAQLAGSISTTTEGLGTILVVSASSSQAASAASLANAVSESIGDQITGTSLGVDAEAQVLFLAEPVDPATAPSSPSSPDLPLMAVLGALAGFAIGVILAGVRAYTDPRVRVRDDIAAAVGGGVAVEGVRRNASRSLVIADDPAHPAAEAYRRLVAEIEAHAETDPARVLVAAPTPHSTASTAAANVAAALAESGKDVVLVDADLRHGSLATLFDLAPEPGLADVLSGGAELAGAVRPTLVAGLRLLPAGHGVDDPHALLRSDAVGLVLADLQASADVVVVSAPPVLTYADAVRLGEGADAAVIVVASGDTRKADLAEASRLLVDAGTPIEGVVLTSVPRRGADSTWR